VFPVAFGEGRACGPRTATNEWHCDVGGGDTHTHVLQGSGRVTWGENDTHTHTHTRVLQGSDSVTRGGRVAKDTHKYD